jgi:glycosidase
LVCLATVNKGCKKIGTPVKVTASFSVDKTFGDSPLTVKFTNTSENGATYLWDFGDQKTSSEKDPVHTFVNPISSATNGFTINLTATATDHTTSICNKTITVYPPAEQYGSPLQAVPAVSEMVMYEINIGAFSKSGNFNGITARLDSLKSLGINTIWLMPIHPIGKLKTIGSPYCVMNYREVNPDFGTLSDFRNLVSEAHKRNLAIIMDWVGNHTSWDNNWMVNKSWYTQDASGNIISPAGTNWNDVADLNFGNADMRAAMISAMKYWILSTNTDGFRCDAADYVPYDFWKQALDTLKNIKGRNLVLLAEGARTDHFAAGFQMNYAWDFLAAIKNVFINNYNAGTIFTTNAAENSGLTDNQRKLRFTTNHDESGNSTPVELFNGKQGALAASVIAIYLQGVPLLYCGQEVGVSNKLTYSTLKPIDWTQNPDMLNGYKQLLSIYNMSAALRKGSLDTFSHADIVTFNKKYGNENMLVMVNTRNKSVNYPVPPAFTGTVWTNLTDMSGMYLAGSITFQPYQYFILKK